MNTENGFEILYVEDSSRDAELTLRALQQHNLANQIHWVKDGAEALEYLFGNEHKLTHMPKLILLDLKLPKVDGLEVLRRIKGDEQAKLIPVVVLTSSREEGDMVESYRLGVNSYVVKPVKFTNFSEAVVKLGMYWLLVNEPLATSAKT